MPKKRRLFHQPYFQRFAAPNINRAQNKTEVERFVVENAHNYIKIDKTGNRLTHTEEKDIKSIDTEIHIRADDYVEIKYTIHHWSRIKPLDWSLIRADLNAFLTFAENMPVTPQLTSENELPDHENEQQNDLEYVKNDVIHEEVEEESALQQWPSERADNIVQLEQEDDVFQQVAAADCDSDADICEDVPDMVVEPIMDEPVMDEFSDESESASVYNDENIEVADEVADEVETDNQVDFDPDCIPSTDYKLINKKVSKSMKNSKKTSKLTQKSDKVKQKSSKNNVSGEAVLFLGVFALQFMRSMFYYY